MPERTVHYTWSHDRKVARIAPASSEGRWRKVWDLGWGLLFVVVLTLLSAYGPRLSQSKIQSARAAESNSSHQSGAQR